MISPFLRAPLVGVQLGALGVETPAHPPAHVRLTEPCPFVPVAGSRAMAAGCPDHGGELASVFNWQGDLDAQGQALARDVVVQYVNKTAFSCAVLGEWDVRAGVTARPQPPGTDAPLFSPYRSPHRADVCVLDFDFVVAGTGRRSRRPGRRARRAGLGSSGPG